MSIHIGVVGLGHNGMAFCRAYQNNPACTLAAVCDTDPKRLDQAAKEFSVKAYSDDQIYHDETIQAISIHTPDHLHKEPFMKALALKKHVFVEKPMANSMDDVLDMWREADKHPDLTVMVGHVLRFVPQYEAIKKMVDANFFGTINYIEADYIHDLRYQYHMEEWKVTREIPMVGGGCHPLDLLRWYVGDVLTVHALSNHLAYEMMHHDTSIVATYRFASGAIGKVTCLYGSPGPCPDMYNLKIYGTKGSLVQRKICMDALGNRWLDLPDDIFVPSHPYEPETDHFLTCIKTSKTPITSAAEGAKSALATLAAAESAKTGQTVTVTNLKSL